MAFRVSSVLVTGAGGFIGSHLAEKCVEDGHAVRAFVHYNSRNSLSWLEGSRYRKDLEIAAGDIRDYDAVYKAVKGTDLVFHLAALVGIPYSYVSPIAYVRTNVEGTYNVLQAAKDHNIQQVILTSTSETYGTAQYVPIDEKHPVVAQSPYAASKIAADQLGLSFYRSYELPVKLVRPFNVYGPRQSARAIVPTIITQILSGRTEIELGSTTPTRDLTFVEDTVDGILRISRADELYGQVTNIGMNEEISIASLARRIARMIGTEIVIQTAAARVRPDKSEVEALRCDNAKLRECTGWEPRYSIETGLAATIEWFGVNLNRYQPESYQI